MHNATSVKREICNCRADPHIHAFATKLDFPVGMGRSGSSDGETGKRDRTK